MPSDADFRAWEDNLVSAWGTSAHLTVRQAATLTTLLLWWAEVTIPQWLDDPDGPLHRVAPFDGLDLRVMVLINENRAWAELAGQRCRAVGTQMASGILPSFGPHPRYFDEVLVALALQAAPAHMRDEDTMDPASLILPRTPDEVTASEHGWSDAVNRLDEVAAWWDWDVPTVPGSGDLRPLLMARHPFTWFDPPPQSAGGSSTS